MSVYVQLCKIYIATWRVCTIVYKFDVWAVMCPCVRIMWEYTRVIWYVHQHMHVCSNVWTICVNDIWSGMCTCACEQVEYKNMCTIEYVQEHASSVYTVYSKILCIGIEEYKCMYTSVIGNIV